MPQTFNLFSDYRLSTIFENQRQELRIEILNENEDRLLNINETKYIQYLVNKYEINPIVVYYEKLNASENECDIPAENFPYGYDVRRGGTYKRQVITYHIPFSGEAKLFKCVPSTFSTYPPEGTIVNGNINFSYVIFDTNKDQIKNYFDRQINSLRSYINNITTDVNAFNNDLERFVKEIIDMRKSNILSRKNLLISLGVPIQNKENVSSTFSLPVIAKKIIVKPSAPTTAFKPEPTIDETIYRGILKVINDTGKAMERLPKTYADKDEESLRDYFLMVLTPHFESTTGETFNLSGKTDILIRHENSNVFVAECKFWHGIEAYYKTIDQLLSYLTWRDSKTAILCFVQNKELDPVLKQIEYDTQKHTCHLKLVKKHSESWFEYDFHLPNDSTRSVKVTVLCFHLYK